MLFNQSTKPPIEPINYHLQDAKHCLLAYVQQASKNEVTHDLGKRFRDLDKPPVRLGKKDYQHLLA